MVKGRSPWPVAFWILLAFAVWAFVFRRFLSSQFSLTSDAISYYGHTRFFIENLGAGVYPLWDPFWCHGSPNDFFLRRIGALNPCYWAILLLKSVGLSYTVSYLWFLALYYWSGMVAFYLLAMRLYQDRLPAYAGYLMLLFSSLGTRLFDSYMLLVTVPLIWFFFFLVAFTQTPRREFFCGGVLAGMVLAGTYVPLYFLIILGFFVTVFALLYFKQIPAVLGCWGRFFQANKMLCLSSLVALGLAFLPAVVFFHGSAQGQVALSSRHTDASAANTLAVAHQRLDWGAMEDLAYSAYFSDLRLLKPAVVYVPFFSVIVLVLGLIGRLTLRAAFLFLLGSALFCCIVPHGLPFYDFFYRHVFFLKYFRNLHFFLWFFLLPLFVLLVLEHWRMFTELLERVQNKVPLWLYVFLAHTLALLFVWWRGDAVPSTYIMIVLSLIFWSGMVLRRLRENAWAFVVLSLAVLVQPLEAYHYFLLKATAHAGHYDYDIPYTSFYLQDDSPLVDLKAFSSKDPLYYASGSYNAIYQNLSGPALAHYLQYKILLFDRVEALDPGHSIPVLEYNFLTGANLAIVTKDGPWPLQSRGDDPNPPLQAKPIDARSGGFKLEDFDANHLRLSLEVPYEKFLVYNDSWDPYWQVSVNHRPAKLYEANGAFKGVWVPAGRSIVEFRYGRCWQYGMNVLLSVLALFFLAATVWYACLSWKWSWE